MQEESETRESFP
jgi:hypothetical protein